MLGSLPSDEVGKSYTHPVGSCIPRPAAPALPCKTPTKKPTVSQLRVAGSSLASPSRMLMRSIGTGNQNPSRSWVRLVIWARVACPPKDPDGNYIQVYHLYPQVLDLQKQMGLQGFTPLLLPAHLDVEYVRFVHGTTGRSESRHL